MVASSKITRYILKNVVTITGKDYWGRDAWITFYPGKIPGWQWQFGDLGEEIIKITSERFRFKARRVALTFLGKKLECFEHIGVLRWLGLDSVVIKSSPWPPYHGRPLELWEKIYPNLEKAGIIDWQPLDRSVRFGSDGRFTSIRNHEEEARFIATVTCRYPGIGAEEFEIDLPGDERKLELALEAHALGWPTWLYDVSKLASRIWWPHHHRITWVQKLGKDETMRLAVQHRMIDLLGVLAFIHPGDGLISGIVNSECAGHEIDLGAIQQLS